MSKKYGEQTKEPKLLPALERRPRATGTRFRYFPGPLTKIDEIARGATVRIISIPGNAKDLTVEVAEGEYRHEDETTYRVMWRDLRR